MKYKLAIIILVIIAIAFTSYYFADKIKLFFQIDSCLDKGCAWDYEINECDCFNPYANPSKYYWHIEYDSISNKEFLEKGELIDSIDLSLKNYVETLNTRTQECKIEINSITQDTVIINILNDEYLSERMGSTGAFCWLGETVYTLTEIDSIIFVKIEMDYGSHASPGVYQRSDFQSLKKDIKANLIGAWGNDENGNAFFGIYTDSIYYPDPNMWCRYELREDTIIITDEYENEERLLILKLTQDSLVVNYIDYDITSSLNRR